MIGCYVGFRYNILGSKMTNTGSTPTSHLSIFLNTRDGFEQTQIWNSDALNVIQGRWLYGNIYLNRMNYNFSLTFRATDYGQGSDSYVALDNIIFSGWLD